MIKTVAYRSGQNIYSNHGFYSLKLSAKYYKNRGLIKNISSALPPFLQRHEFYSFVLYVSLYSHTTFQKGGVKFHNLILTLFIGNLLTSSRHLFFSNTQHFYLSPFVTYLSTILRLTNFNWSSAWPTVDKDIVSA